MANKLFEKIESDALAAIDAIDAEYAYQQANVEIARLRAEVARLKYTVAVADALIAELEKESSR